MKSSRRLRSTIKKSKLDLIKGSSDIYLDQYNNSDDSDFDMNYILRTGIYSYFLRTAIC